MKILVIEDDRGIVEIISLIFEMRWPEVNLISTAMGEKGVNLVESEKPDIVILDLGLPDISGYDALKDIRAISDVPILILTVRSEEADIIKGLEFGADDYVIKPFRQMELLSRIQALVRRAALSRQEKPLVFGELHFTPSTTQLFYRQKEIRLTRTESVILHQLMRNAGRVVTNSSLTEAVWGEEYPDAVDSLRVYIRRLREKIEDDPGNPKLIVTKTGIGYSLAKPG